MKYEWKNIWRDEWKNEWKNEWIKIFICHLSTDLSTCPFIQCSTSCGSGTRKRSVKCIAVKTGLASTQCTQGNKPNTHEECNIKKCPSERTGKLSKYLRAYLFENWLNIKDSEIQEQGNTEFLVRAFYCAWNNQPKKDTPLQRYDVIQTSCLK